MQFQRKRITGTMVIIPRRGSVRTLGIVLAATLLVVMMTPFMGGPSRAVAAPAQPSQPSGASHQDGEAGENGGIGDTPVIEETPVDGEDPEAVETPEGEQNPDGEGTTEEGINALQADPYQARIIVSVRECDDPFQTFQEYDVNCRDFKGHQFDVYGVDNAGQGIQVSGEYYQDVSGIGGGQYTIRSFTPNDYRSPAVFCSRGEYKLPQGPYQPTVTVDGYYEFTLAPGERIACHWFYVPRITGYGALKMGFSVCPPVSEIPFPFDYATANFSDLANVCSIYRDGRVQFSAYNHSTGITTKESTDPANYGIAWWPGQPEGGQTVTTERWAGYGTPRSVCFYSNDSGNIFELSVNSNWETELEVREGQTTICDWWIIPGSEQPVTLGGAVSIVGYTCDANVAGVKTQEANHEQLLAECEPGGDARNSFSVSSGGSAMALAGTGEDGSATWRDIPAGDLTISGTGDQPVVFCTVSNPALLVFESIYEQVEVANGTFGYHLDENYSLSCDWFSVSGATGDVVTDEGDDEDPVTDEDEDPATDEDEDTDSENGSVTVVAFACGDGADGLSSVEDFQENCTEPVDGAVFKLDGERSGNPGEKIAGADGSVTWDNREADHYYFYRQEVPDTYRSPAVFCGIYTEQDQVAPALVPMTVADGWRVDFDLAEGESIGCVWFDTVPGTVAGDGGEDSTDADGGNTDAGNADGDGGETPVTSGEGGSITVYEWSCPAGFDVAGVEASPWVECAVATDGIELTVAGPDGFADTQTAAGEVTWNELASGEYQIDDTQSESDATGVVLACHGLTEPTAYPVYSTASGAPMTISLAEGQQVACFWFDVPAEA